MSAAKLTGIEAARGVAAFGVVAFHATVMLTLYYDGPKALLGLFDFGHAAVDFFFVLSGFIVWSAHGKLMGQPDKVAIFLWRRFARIYPTFWAALTLLLLTYAVFARLGVPLTDWTAQGWPRIVANIFAWPIEPPYILDITWTLPYEILFYLLFTVAVWNKRLGIGVFVAWQAVVIAVNLWTEPPASTFWFRYQHLDFGLGILAALWLKHRRLRHPIALLWTASLLFLAAGLATDAGWVGPAWRPLKLLFAVASALIIVALVEAERQNRLQAPDWMVRLGGASYSIFLVHLILLEPYLVLLQRWGLIAALPQDLVFALGVAGGMGLGIAFHHLVEKPFMHLPTPPFLR